MTLTEIAIDIHQRETGTQLTEELAAELRDLAETCGVESNPRWLLPLLSAVQEGHVISPPVFVEFEDSDLHTYLLELGLLLHWKFEHPGEYDAIEFPRLGWRIYVSHEASSPAGKPGSKYDVARL